MLYWLYLESVEREKSRLLEMARLYAHQVETIGSLAVNRKQRVMPQMSEVTQKKKVLNDQVFFHRFGKTGEIVLLEMEQTLRGPKIFGETSTKLQSGRQGRIFLTATVPLEKISRSVVVRMDIQEIQVPYFQAGFLIILLEFLIIWFGRFVRFSGKTEEPRYNSEKEATIQAIVASAGEGIVTFNESSIIETFNETAETMFLYSIDEMIGKPFQTLLTKSDQNICDTFLLTYRPQGTSRMAGVVKEFQAQRKDGTVFPLTLTLTEAPMWGHRLFTVLLRDVTEQKMTERRLAAQYAVARVLAECETIQEATPEILRAVCEILGWQVGILWQVDSEIDCLRCVEVWQAIPDRFSRFVELTQGMSFVKGVGLPGRTWEQGQPAWIPDVVQDSNFPRAPLASEEGLHAAFAFPIQLGNATYGVMEFFSREIQEPDQALLHQMLSVGHQIGQFMQRKITENALRDREEQTRLILDTALDAVVTFNETGHVLSWNSQAERMFGWSREDILGQSFVSIIIPPTYRQGYLDGLQRYIRTGASEMLDQRVELYGFHRDGHEFPLEIAMTAIPSTGQYIFSGFFRDLTQRRQTEDALRKSEEQLRQAQKMEAIGTLAGGIAHDFNNILSSIIGYTELAMARSDVNSTIVPRLQEVLKAGYRAKKLIRQILTFSRQDKFGKKVIYLQPILEEALHLLRASLPSTIFLEIRIEKTTPPVLADATQIHQVVMNLGANAEYAMRESGGKLMVKLDQVVVEEGSVLVELGLSVGLYSRLIFSDSGKGIPRHIQKRIFDPFFTTKDVGEGTGMGLSVIHGVVTSHGGTIQVESQEGEGATFLIYLPCTLVGMSTETPTSVAPLSSFGQGTVMFVDDEVSIAHWGKDTLEALGYRVSIYFNASDALKAFQENPESYDVLVTDQTMPGMTGETLAQEVMKVRQDFPVILCSGFSYSMNEKKARTIGLQAYLTKPVLMDDMARAIQAAMQGKISQSPV